MVVLKLPHAAGCDCASCLKQLQAALRRHLGIGFRVRGKARAAVRMLCVLTGDFVHSCRRRWYVQRGGLYGSLTVQMLAATRLVAHGEVESDLRKIVMARTREPEMTTAQRKLWSKSNEIRARLILCVQ